MLTHDPWVLGFVFLLGVIVGHDATPIQLGFHRGLLNHI